MLLATMLLLGAGPVRDLPFTSEAFETFVAGRAGTGKPVYWYCEGEIYKLPSGELIARMDGVDTARRLPSAKQGVAFQASRKVFRYLDPNTSAELKQVNGKDLARIAYPYQYIEYSLSEGKMIATVEQGAGARLQTVSANQARYRLVNGALVYSIPLFVSVKLPTRTLNAYENYDFFFGKGQAPRLSWNRVSDLPPAFGEGQCVMQLVATRYDRFTDLPQAFRDFIEKDAPLWKAPPVDEAEIRQLQAKKP